jgi:tRNA(adenine34) deaminase
MKEALAEARLAAAAGEVPVGAVVVRGGEIVGRGHNMTETASDPTMHAEMIAIRQAAEKLGNWRLTDCEMYVTAEPCPMCAGACVSARLAKVNAGAPSPISGAAGTNADILTSGYLNHKVGYEAGMLEEECAQIMKDFFKERRRKK